MSVTQFHARLQPIGTYRAVSCRDAASQARDREPYLLCNLLHATNGRPEVEVMFADGAWLLADPTSDLVPGFELDPLPDQVFLAQSYGEPWNGWATPMVDQPTLATLLTSMETSHQWSGDLVHLEDEGDDAAFLLLGPDAVGNYDLGVLGWRFERLPI